MDKFPKKDSDLVYSEIFNNEKDLFNKVEYCEYFFKMIFCYVIPIYTVLMIIKKEFKYASEQHLMAQTSDFITKEKNSKGEQIKGLHFQYH